MFGFVFGTACLVGLAFALKGGHGCSHHGWHHGWHHGHGPGFRGWGPRVWLRGAFERLETTPGQEKALIAIIEELAETARSARTQAMAARQAVADAVRRDQLGEAEAAEAFAQADAGLSKVRMAAAQALAKAHEVLDPKQRRQLAAWIAGDSWWNPMPCGHPYRCA